MKPVHDMVPGSLRQVVSKACNRFVEDFAPDTFDRTRKALLHNGKWKEADRKLECITKEILDTL